MTEASAKLLREALLLTEEERLDLASELLASVDGPTDPEWEQAWHVELDRRSSAIDGTQPPEWAATRTRILTKLGAL